MANQSKEKDDTNARGVPLKSVVPENLVATMTVFTLLFHAIGYAIARYGLYRGEAAVSAANAKLEAVHKNDMGWLYLTLFLVRILQFPIGLLAGVARKESKINPPDQQVYVVKGAEGSRLGCVLMENEGASGRFNRAQRAFCNYHENFPTVCFQFMAASWVFPRAACVCMVLFCVAAIVNAEGYVRDVSGRTNGFLIGIPAIYTLQGMLFFVAHQTLM